VYLTSITRNCFALQGVFDDFSRGAVLTNCHRIQNISRRSFVLFGRKQRQRL